MKLLSYREEQEQKQQDMLSEMLSALPPFCEDFLYYKERRANSLTLTAYFQRIKTFLEYLVTNDIRFAGFHICDITTADLAELTLDDVSRFTHFLRRGGASGKTSVKETTISNYLSALSALWQYLVKTGNVDKNIFLDVERARKETHVPIALTKDQEAAMLQTIETGDNLTRMQMTHRDEVSAARDAAIYLLFMRTGLRVSELVGLNVDDVNLEKRFVRVMRKGSREDTVFFSDQAADALRTYLICRPLLSPGNDEKALFLVTIGKYKGSRLSVRSVQNLVKKYGKAAVPEVSGLHVHSLRSSYATRSLEATRDLRLVQLQLNHKSPTTTSFYLKDRDDEKDKHRNDLD